MKRIISLLLLLLTLFLPSCFSGEAKEIKEYFSTPKTLDIIFSLDGETFEGELEICGGKTIFSPSDFEGLSFEKSKNGVICRYDNMVFELNEVMVKLSKLFDTIDTLAVKTGALKNGKYQVGNVFVSRNLPYNISFDGGYINIK